jgi:hypothetical protein
LRPLNRPTVSDGNADMRPEGANEPEGRLGVFPAPSSFPILRRAYRGEGAAVVSCLVPSQAHIKDKPMLNAQECEAIINQLVAQPMEFLAKTTISLDSDPVETYEKQATPSPMRFALEKGKADASFTNYVSPTALDGKSVVTEGLQAYFLPWARGRKLAINLPKPGTGAAVLVMTASLTGCAVGYWRAPDGSARFYHVNVGGDGSMEAKRDQANQVLTKALNKRAGKSGSPKERQPGGIFNTESYGWGTPKVVRGSVCGVIREGRWEFFGQKIAQGGIRNFARVISVTPF